MGLSVIIGIGRYGKSHIIRTLKFVMNDIIHGLFNDVDALFLFICIQCTNDMTFSISADTDNHRYNPIFISADTDKKPIQIFLYRPIPIPITDITSFVIYAFFIMLNVYFLASKLGDAGGASTPTHFCPSQGFLLWISTFFE